MARVPDIAVVPIEHDLDVSSVSSVRRELEALVDGGCRRIFLNMAGSGYADSAGLGLIISIARQMRAAGGLVSLMNVPAQLGRALALARLTDMIPVADARPRPELPVLDRSARPEWQRTIRVEADGLSHARNWIAELLRRLPLSPDEVFDMTLASGEALGNAVDHACAEGMTVSVARYADRVIVEVCDCGPGCDPASIEPAAPHAERGRGIALMRLLADAVSIGPRPGGPGTDVVLVKRIGA